MLNCWSSKSLQTNFRQIQLNKSIVHYKDRRFLYCQSQGKGFGSQNTKSPDAVKQNKKGQGKGYSEDDIQQSEFKQYLSGDQGQNSQLQIDQKQFEERLQMLKDKGQSTKELIAQKVDEVTNNGQVDYKNSPTVLETIKTTFGFQGEKVNEDYKGGNFGPSKTVIGIGGAVVSLLVVAVWGFGSFLNVPSSKDKSKLQELQMEEINKITQTLDGFKSTVEKNPDDVEAQKGIVVSYLYLRDFPNAEVAVKKVLQKVQDDANTYRVAGEIEGAQQKFAEAEKYYLKSLQINPNDANSLQGYCGALVKQMKQQQAIDYLMVQKDKVMTQQQQQKEREFSNLEKKIQAQSQEALQKIDQQQQQIPQAQVDQDSSRQKILQLQQDNNKLLAQQQGNQGKEQVEGGSQQGAQSDKIASSAAEQLVQAPSQDYKKPQLSLIDIDLLIGKVYSNWKGHSVDAMNLYNQLVEIYPSDFRGYLAKGVLFKKQGKKAESYRMFIQAKFMAPKELQPFVQNVQDTTFTENEGN